MTNRLVHATSPYLLQHAENPVQWWEFTPEAFDSARQRDVPVLLSVGYAACHWCHVMAHESFEDPETARQMNEQFVSVKVDREQRPDVDATYMAATQLLTGQGGWPMTVFLTPEGRVFHAGTYYPPRPVQGRPSFRQVMTAVTEAWTQRRDEVLRGAQEVSEALSRHPDLVERMLADAGPSLVTEPGAGSATDPVGDLVGAWLDGLEVARDAAHEGFGTGAKFPPSPALDALVRIAAGQGEREQPRAARELLCATLDAMVTGALQDHVGGGFFRYSVTPDWSLPHYEKMLYDNAQLLGVLARTAHLLEERGIDPARAARYRHAATALVDWLLREMVTPEGALAASLDADSDPAPDEPHAEREGAYYTFSRADGGAAGSRPAPVTAAWGEAGAVTGILDESLRSALWERRTSRAAPHRDDKVVTAWNGMALTALAEAAVLLDRPEWLEPAVAAAGFLWEHHRQADTGTVARTSRGGVVDPHEGQLEDYACLGAGLLALYRASGDTLWYERSLALAGATVERFVRGEAVVGSARVDPALAAAGATGRAEPFDDVAAAAPAVLARWLVELAQPEVAGRRPGDVVSAVTARVTGMVLKAPTAAGGTVAAVLAEARPPEVLQVAHATAEQWEQVLAAVGSRRVLDSLILDAAVAPYGTPASEGGFTVWRCRDGRCELPVHSAAQLRA
ncbi:thioredoxin domain-containing protein [Kocuria sp.]|uniref:thioredoxin domain-containing protein n=1 Tax=Kocuria sp. TaxID=1871328 RepID=UPI0026DCB978|nr:thioredoxin domain-containing protein [Kocuria sp.]MDO4919358.1 thioredoxin domain-containing protein [Kocuria sp.]